MSYGASRTRELWTRLEVVGLVALATLTVGTIAYSVLENWSVFDSFYMTLITITTVGFGEVHPLDTSGRVVTICIIVTGVTLIGMTASIAAQLVQDGALGERGRKRRMKHHIEALRDHYIVCGYGRVGRSVVATLKAQDVTAVVIDRDPEREKDLFDDDTLYVLGDATLEKDLHLAGIEHAAALISAVDDDAENIFITMVARSVHPDIWIVARAAEATSEDRLLRAGANRVYSPYVTAGQQMASAAIGRPVAT